MRDGGRENFFTFLSARSAEIISQKSLAAKLGRNRPLRVKLGIDPTTPDLHLGHIVPLRILRAFQDAGHRAVLIIGDFTGQIGDPSGAATARRQLTAREVKQNERTYLSQAGKILHLRKSEVHHNSEWYGNMGAKQFLDVLAKFSLKSAWQREDFQKRLAAGKEVHLHEAMYHVLQAYDSVAVRSGVEIGSVDQRLNMIAGRELQAKVGQAPQDIVLMPYLIGLDGKLKMSKSFGNTINILDTPGDMFGKVMAVPDALIIHYAELAAWQSAREVNRMRKRLERSENPRDVKLDLAETITALYHGNRTAARVRGEFLKLFSRREITRSVPTVRLARRAYAPLELLAALGVAASKSEARRLLAGKAVEVDGRVLTPADRRTPLRSGSVIRVGKKRFFRVR